MYRKNVASQFIHFQGVDSATGGIKSGVTWTVRRCLDGTFAAATGTASEDGTTGWYKFALSQADTNGNNCAFNFTGTGAVPQTVNFVTTACDPTVATNFGITSLPTTAVTTNGSLITSGTGTAQLSVTSGRALSDVDTIKTNPVVNAGTITFPTTATLASTTNITAGTVTTATNVTTVNGLAANVITATSIAADAITDAKVAADVTIASVTGNVGGNVVGTVGTVNALAANVITATSINTGAITSAKFAAGAIDAAAIATGAIDADAVAADAATEIANAVWDTDATGRQTQGTFGQAIGDPAADTNTIYKAVVTDATGATVGVDVVAIKAETASIQSDTNDLQTQVGTAGAGLTNINLPDQTMNITGNLSGSVGSVTSAVDISAAAVDLVWDEPTAGHATAGTTGKALTDAGSAGDPWGTALPGAYAAGTAGKIVGDNINAPIATVDTVVDAIKAKTDSLAFTVAGQVDSNVQYVNDIEVTGDGQTGTEWGPI